MAEEQPKPKRKHKGRDVIPGFGPAVRAKRERMGLTIKQVALEVGSSTCAISEIERNVKAPSLRIAGLIAKALHLSIDKIVGIEPN